MFNFWRPSHANGKPENSTFSYMEVYTMNERSVSDYYFISNIFSLQILFRNALTSYLKAPQIEGSQLPALPKPRGRVYPVRPEVAPKKQRKAIEVKTTPTVVKSPRRMMSGCSSNKLISIFVI